jgi:hypothetical protein
MMKKWMLALALMQEPHANHQANVFFMLRTSWS